MTPSRRPTRHRAALLLEAILALVLVVVASLALLGVIGDAASSAAQVRDQRRAYDAAASALALMQAGIASPEALAGPVRFEQVDDSRFDDSLPPESPWILEVDTEPLSGGEVPGGEALTLVRVSVLKRGGDSRTPVASLTHVLNLRFGGALR